MGQRQAFSWDVTLPDTYAESHVSSTAVTPGAAAHSAALSKTDKYTKLTSTHIFCPFAIVTAGAWHETAIEVMQEIGRRIMVVTEDTRETEFLFQCLSMALQWGMRSPSRTLWSPNETSLQPFTLFSVNISACGFVLVGLKNNNNNNFYLP